MHPTDEALPAANKVPDAWIDSEAALEQDGACLEDAPELAKMIDAQAVQSLMEDFYKLSRIPMSMIDLRGNVLVGVGWQEICTKFHRAHPVACRHCLESDTQLSDGVPPGASRLYRCKNHMWDIATPIMVAGRHVGNIFSGQFFFEGETLNHQLFREQAQRFGFDEVEYLAALEAVPRLNWEDVETGMRFLTKLAQMLGQMSYNNAQLERALRERDRLMVSLRESERDLNRAQAVAQTGSWRLDVRRNELLWSAETYRLFGIQRGTPLTYETFLSAVHPNDRDYVDSHWQKALHGGPYDIEHRIIVAGETRWLRERAELEFETDGSLRGGFGTVQDVTERKQMELALRQNEELLQRHTLRLEETVQERTAKLQEMVTELEHYSYTITHDMRAPLRAMQGFAAILLEDCRECFCPERLDLLRRIAAASTRMDQLIHDALDYSRVVRNELPLVAVDLDALLRGIVESYPNLRAPLAHIEIIGLLPWVIGNEAGLTQCFSNLLSNAVKFVSPGVIPQVRIAGETRGSTVRVSVQDNGIGIAKDWHERIFQMFQRASREYDGTGIGLALVRKVVQRMGGQVGVESELGKGSRFWVELQQSPNQNVAPGK